MKTTRDTKRQDSPSPSDIPQRRDRRLHQRRQVLAAQPAHRRRRARREPALRDPRPDGAPYRDRRRPRLHARPTPSASCATCRTSSSRRSARRSRRSPTPTCCCTWSTGRTPTPRARSPRCARCSPRSAPTRCREIIVDQQGRRRRPEVLDRLRRHETHCVVVSRPHRRRASRSCARAHRPTSCRSPTSSSTCSLPYDRGDLITRLHEEGEILESEHVAEGTRLRAKVTPTMEPDLAAYAVVAS